MVFVSGMDLFLIVIYGDHDQIIRRKMHRAGRICFVLAIIQYNKRLITLTTERIKGWRLLYLSRSSLRRPGILCENKRGIE